MREGNEPERREGNKTLISVLALLISGITIFFIIQDRYSQHAKPNIERFEGKTENGQATSQQIASLDASSEDLYQFLKRNLGKRIYLDISFNIGDEPPNVSIDPLGVPSSGQAFEFSFIASCSRDPGTIPNPVGQGICNDITVHIDPAKDVERQVNNIYGGTFQVKGYFFDNLIETHMGVQDFTLKPISAHQVLT
jgi:hypothetical protein